jgi:hypothetical protein
MRIALSFNKLQFFRSLHTFREFMRLYAQHEEDKAPN